jgi:hypothetical protein
MIKNRRQRHLVYCHSILNTPSEQKEQKRAKMAYMGRRYTKYTVKINSDSILNTPYIYIYSIGSCLALVINEREKRLIITESERLNQEIDTPDNKERTNGITMHVFPQEKIIMSCLVSSLELLKMVTYGK